MCCSTIGCFTARTRPQRFGCVRETAALFTTTGTIKWKLLLRVSTESQAELWSSSSSTWSDSSRGTACDATLDHTVINLIAVTKDPV